MIARFNTPALKTSAISCERLSRTYPTSRLLVLAWFPGSYSGKTPGWLVSKGLIWMLVLTCFSLLISFIFFTSALFAEQPGSAELSNSALGPRFEITTEPLSVTYGYGPSEPFSNPQGVFYDRNTGEIYVADAGNHRVVILSPVGIPTYKFNHTVEVRGKFMPGQPKSIVVDETGTIFLTDALADYIDVLDMRGRSLDRIRPSDYLDEPVEDLIFPKQLSLDSTGKLYVTVGGSELQQIFVFDLYGELLARYGEKGDQPGQFDNVLGIFVDGSGKIYTTDLNGPMSVQVFDADGQFLFGFGKHDFGRENFSYPASICVTDNGTIWVADAIRQVIKAFTTEGEFLFYTGGMGTRPGEMQYPISIATDGKERIFVLERAGKRLQTFRFIETIVSSEATSFRETGKEAIALE